MINLTFIKKSFMYKFSSIKWQSISRKLPTGGSELKTLRRWKKIDYDNIILKYSVVHVPETKEQQRVRNRKKENKRSIEELSRDFLPIEGGWKHPVYFHIYPAQHKGHAPLGFLCLHLHLFESGRISEIQRGFRRLIDEDCKTEAQHELSLQMLHNLCNFWTCFWKLFFACLFFVFGSQSGKRMN